MSKHHHVTHGLRATLTVAALMLFATSCALLTRVSQTDGNTLPDAASSDVALSATGRFAVFTTAATDMTPNDTNGSNDIYLRDNQSGTTELISVTPAGVAGTGSSHSADISGDGRYVVFVSSAADLVAGDTNGTSDVFVRDRQNGTTELVSVTGVGLAANSSSNSPSVSDDGRFVAFATFATNLFAGDTNGTSDVVLKDRLSGINTPVSRSTNPIGPTDGASTRPTIAADGSVIVYESYATNIVTDDTNGELDVFHWTRVGATNQLVSRDVGGNAANGPSRKADVSADGETVAFESSATDLVANDTNTYSDIFLRAMTPATTELISTSTAGGSTNFPSEGPAISGDGTRVSFHASASNLVPDDTNGFVDAFVWQAGSDIERVSVTLDLFGSVEGNGSSFWPDLSDDGTAVGFATAAQNLTGETTATTNGANDIVVRAARVPHIDSTSTTILRVGSAREVTFTGRDFAPDATVLIPGGAGVATIVSQTSTEIVADVTALGDAGDRDVWVVNPQPQLGQGFLGAADRVSMTAWASPRSITIGADASVDNADDYDISDRYVVFSTEATNILPGDTNGVSDVFRYDRITGTTELVSEQTNGNPFLAATFNPSISNDGRFVAFEGESTIVGNRYLTVWLKDMDTGTATIIAPLACVDSPFVELEPHISGNGNWMTFRQKWTSSCTSDTGIVRYDRTNDLIEWVTVDSSGQPWNGPSYKNPSISEDGTRIATERSVNLGVLYDLTLPPSDPGYSTTLYSGAVTPRPWISGDGGTVAMTRNSPFQVYTYDHSTGVTAQAVFDENGGNINQSTGPIDLDHSGDRLAFRTGATDLDHAIGDPSGDLYVQDRVTGDLLRIGNGQIRPRISPNGSCAVYGEYGTDLVLTDLDGTCTS